MGYVGLPLGVAFAEAGHEVVGLDVDARRVDAVNRGDSLIEDISSERLRALERPVPTGARPDLYGGGRSGERICDVLDSYTPQP